MTAELIIGLAALAVALFAAARTYTGQAKFCHPKENAAPAPDRGVCTNAKKGSMTKDVLQKTLRSIEDYRK